MAYYFIAGSPVHSFHFLSALQSSHGPISTVMEAVERIYGMVHMKEENLYPLSSSQEKSPLTSAYFEKIARFRNATDLHCEECFYHVSHRGEVVEVREESGLQDGYEPAHPVATHPEDGEDYAWYYGRLHRDEPAGQQRFFVSL